MNNNDTPYNTSYIFHVQSLEDFQRQLIEYAIAEKNKDDNLDLSDLSLAQEMLKEIGIEIN